MDNQQWAAFLNHHNLTWSRITDRWDQGAFLGNGMMGAMIYKDEGDVLRWELGRCDVVAHFQFENIDWGDPRVPIGDLLLKPAGKIRRESMELDLWSAQAGGTIETDRGEIRWRSFVHAEAMVLAIELQTAGDEQDAQLSFRPKHGISPCLTYDYTKKHLPENWRECLPPEPSLAQERDTNLSIQPFLKGGECVTAWREKRLTDHHRILYLSIANSFPERTARDEAIRCVEEAASQPWKEWTATHQAWWHAYYPQSFVSLPDTRWEGFYWIQMYKLASATRADGALIDSQGPWLTRTPWPTCVWNLNVQLSYSPAFIANRLDLAGSLAKSLDANRAQLIGNVPPQYRDDSAAVGRSTSCVELKSPTDIEWELGNLTWACHNYWRLCSYSMNAGLMRDGLYPLLRRAINFYLHFLAEEEDGRLHLPPTHSPEYGRNLTTRDANYDLALLRWGCRTLIDLCGRLAIDDALIPRWQDILKRLADPPVDENGLRVGRDLPFAESHRHYSHLLGIFPLHLISPDFDRERALIIRSLEHWIGFEGALQGYSLTGAAAIYAMLGQGDLALKHLNGLREFLTPNTMYVENGPVIETPLSAAESIHYMLLASWGGTIRVFPAVPHVWHDLVFHNLRTEGGFLISAVRKAGRTRWIRVTSLFGEPCRIQTDMKDVHVAMTASGKWSSEADGLMRLALEPGESALLHEGPAAPECIAAPLPADPEYCNYYGMAQPFAAEQDIDGTVELPAARATIHGDSITYVKSAHKNKLGGWSNPADWIEWPIRLQGPGRFTVLITYACPEEAAGGAFTITCGGQTLEAWVDPTESWETYREIAIGELTLSKTDALKLDVRARSIPSSSLMDLRCLRLVPSL